MASEMITVALLVGASDSPTLKDLYVQPYLRMQHIFAQQKLSLVRIPLNAFQDTGTFSHYFILDGRGHMQKISKTITPDIIWVRTSSSNLYGEKLAGKLPIVPELSVRILSADKYETYLHLQDFMPTTALLGSFLSSPKVQEKFGNQIVLKPIRNYGGRGIEFVDKGTLLPTMDRYLGSEQSFIVQEFKDFSQGYKNLITGIHDLRLVYVGDDLSFSVVRTPKPGDLRSNVTLGGTQKSIDINDIPDEVLELAQKIKTQIGIGSQNIFSLDFGYCAGEKKWYFLEINASPGIRFPEKDRKWELKYFTDLTKFFITKVKGKI